jgi:hypothetical protein
MATHGVPTNPEGSRFFSQTVEAASGLFEASRHATGLETDARLKTVTKPENKN